MYNTNNWIISHSKNVLIVPVVLSVLVFLLLVLFQPFEYRSNSLHRIISDALLSAFLVFFAMGLTRLSFSFLFENKLLNVFSLILNEVVKAFFDIILFLIFSFLINIIFASFDTINYSVWLLLSLKYILIFELIFIPLSIFLNYYFYHYSFVNRDGKPRIQHGIADQYTNIQEQKLILGAIDKEKQLEILPDCLVMVKSCDNYVKVFYKEHGTVVSGLLRNTICNIIDIVSEYPYIIQCHRSYLINVNEVSKVKGNTRGYQLVIKGVLDTVPVSRSKIARFREALNK